MTAWVAIDLIYQKQEQSFHSNFTELWEISQCLKFAEDISRNILVSK